MESEATSDSANAREPYRAPKEMEFRLQRLTPIAARALATADYWYFYEAIFILAGWYVPHWAWIAHYFTDDAAPISLRSLRCMPEPPVDAELPPDVWGVAHLYYKSWLDSLPELERQQHNEQNAPKDEPAQFFHPGKASPKEWLNWANECLLDALPEVLRSLVTTETPDERRERMARLRTTLTAVQIAKIEGISPQRVRQIIAKRDVARESEDASPLRIGQLLPRGKPPK